jgi:hypothetical protein
MAMAGEMASAATKEPQKEQRAAAPVDIKSVLKVPWSKTGGFKLPEASAKTEVSKATSSISFDPKSLLQVPWSKTGGFKLPEAGAEKSSVPALTFDVKSLLKVPWKSTASSAPASPAEPFRPSALLKVPWSKTGGKKFLLPNACVEFNPLRFRAFEISRRNFTLQYKLYLLIDRVRLHLCFSPLLFISRGEKSPLLFIIS